VDRTLTIALAKAAIRDFRFHDFRHTCAIRLVQAGEDLYKIQKYLGTYREKPQKDMLIIQ
jgi:integrase